MEQNLSAAPENIDNDIEQMSEEDCAEMLGQIPMLIQIRKERQDELDLLGENTKEVELKARLEQEIEELNLEIAGREELERGVND